MTLTIHIADTLRSVATRLPRTLVVQKPEAMTIRELALDVGIPPILIVFASVDGVRKSLNDVITGDATIQFFGTMAGG
jgi:hypothetical protein